MGQTVIPYGSPQAVKLQSIGLFAASMQRLTLINRLTGKMSQQADAENRLRVQSSTDMPIVQVMDLTKTAGEEVTFDLVNPIGGKPIMGGRMAEGRGEKMSFSQDKLRINQSRKPISAGDTMTQQRTPHQLRQLARAQGKGYMDRLLDQLPLVHMAGARGSHFNIEWAIPLETDEDYASIMVNPVKAPSNNRHYISNGTGIEKMGVTGGETNVTTTDVFNIDVLDDIRAMVESIPLPPPPVKFPGDPMAEDNPLRVLLVSSDQFAAFQRSSTWRPLVANAAARGAKNPLFTGDVGLWNGILMVRMPKPIRFYSGDTIKYCADPYSEVESTCTVPAALGAAGMAIDRAILLGGQALAQAWGKNSKTSNPFFWSEKELDHGDKLEVLIGMIHGMSKVRFDIDFGTGAASMPTDFGITVIDTAVKMSAGS